MCKTLGLTISYDTIGWALLDDANESPLVDMGVGVFTPSVDHVGEGVREQSSLMKRTQLRLARKVSRRKRIRKQKLLEVLIAHKLCPLPEQALQKWIDGGSFPGETLALWMALDPYELRLKATTQRIDLLELGRIFYHMAQRRGKCYVATESSLEHRTYFQGKPEINRLGLSATLADLKPDQTLGAYLSHLKPAKGQPYKRLDFRVRNRYLDRFMYVEEFHKIFSFQQQFHTQLSEDLRRILGGSKGELNDGKSGVIFFQRPLKFPKKHKRFCPFEPKKKRTPISHPEYEIFQVLHWINSIRCNGRPLTARQRESAMKIPFRFSQFSFKRIRKALDMEDPTIQFNYEDTTVIKLAHTLVHLSKPQLFGTAFLERPLEEQIQVWHTLYFFDDPDKLKKHALRHWGCSEAQAECLSKLQLATGYGAYSLKATRTITPFLKAGMRFDKALFFSALTRGIGSHWQTMSLAQKGTFVKDFSELARKKNKSPYGFEQIQNKLKTDYNIDEFDQTIFMRYYRNLMRKKTARLEYGMDTDQHIKTKFKPIAQKSVFELRKLINGMIDAYGKIDRIKVYVRPEMKSSRSSRKKQFAEKKRRSINQRYHLSAVKQMGKNPTHLNVLKHRLWEEFDRHCPYTGQSIDIEMLFSEEVSVIHILPWNRFFNDSDINKALCVTSFKDLIQNRTPWEYFSEQPTGVWEQLKLRVLKQLMRNNKYNGLQKFRQFVRSSYALNAKNNELKDTHHVSLAIQNFLNQICDDVQMTLGHATHSLREKWYLDRIENFLQPEDPLHDYRRHAIDALVTAVKTPFFLDALTDWNRYEMTPHRDTFPYPWPDFKNEVRHAFQQVRISFSRSKKVLMPANTTYYKDLSRKIARSPSARGRLHRELFYGLRKSPGETQVSFHIRKPLQQISTAKQVQKIVDPEIKKRIYAHIDALGGFDKGKVPKNSLTFLDDKGFTRSQISLPNRRGEAVPVKKVRMREQIGNAIQLHPDKNVYVNSRNNHHVMVYENLLGEMDQEVVTFWTAVQRKNNHEPIYQLPEDGIRAVATLQINDCFLMGLTDQELKNWQLLPKSKLYEHVYRVQRVSHRFYEFRHVFDANIYDTSFPNYIRILNFGKRKTGWKTYNPKKIHVDLLGKLSDFTQNYVTNKQPQSQS